MIHIYDNFFTTDECNQFITEVVSNREKWVVSPLTQFRIFGQNFFHHWLTNGTSSINDYRTNGFSTPMHDVFKKQLSKIFPKVEYTQNFAKPGYIVTMPDYKSPALWHYDNELGLFPYSIEFPDYTNDFESYFDKFYTFVVMLSDGEYSFDYYPETISSYKNTSEEEMSNSPCIDHMKLIGDNCPNPNCQLKDYSTVNYKQGMLLVQESRFLHRASPAKFKSKNDLRIIVRAYGVVKNDILYVFW